MVCYPNEGTIRAIAASKDDALGAITAAARRRWCSRSCSNFLRINYSHFPPPGSRDTYGRSRARPRSSGRNAVKLVFARVRKSRWMAFVIIEPNPNLAQRAETQSSRSMFDPGDCAAMINNGQLARPYLIIHG